MSRQVFINLPIEDLERSTTFYEALGFVKDPIFSSENASSMQWSSEIVIMLLKKDFYKAFIGEKDIIDPSKTSGALIALSLDSKEAVQNFAEAAKENGGDYYSARPQTPEDMMFGYEVSDPDGHILEPIWMNQNFKPES